MCKVELSAVIIAKGSCDTCMVQEVPVEPSNVSNATYTQQSHCPLIHHLSYYCCEALLDTCRDKHVLHEHDAAEVGTKTHSNSNILYASHHNIYVIWL